MRARLLVLLAVIAVGPQGAPVRADSGVTAEEARSKFEAAVTLYREEGEKAFDKFADKHGPFLDRDFYVSVVARDGECLFHGLDKSLIGQNLWQLIDPDGIQIIQEQWHAAESDPDGGKVRFKFYNPLTKAIDRKVTFVRKVRDTMITGGYYLDN